MATKVVAAMVHGRRVSSFGVIAAVACVGGLLVAAPVTASYQRPGKTSRFDACGQASCMSSSVAFSRDGRFVVFESGTALFPDLFPGLKDPVGGLFMWDRLRNRAELISAASNGLPALGSSQHGSLSANLRYVAFESTATNLVVPDSNLATDVFVRDRRAKRTERASVSSAGKEADGTSGFAAISSNGRYVAFESTATNLVKNDTNGVSDVFVRDRKTDTTQRVSVSSQELEAVDVPGGPGSLCPSISANGRYVAFESNASNLVDGDTNAFRDVFVRDRTKGVTRRISVASDGAQGNGPSFATCRPATASHTGVQGITADGGAVVFMSRATNLIPMDTNRDSSIVGFATDVFVRDIKAGRTERVTVSSTGEESEFHSGNLTTVAISSGGRYVSFSSNANNLTPGDTGELTPLNLLDAAGDLDVVLYDRTTGAMELVSVNSAGEEAGQCPSVASAGTDSYFIGMSPDARFVMFKSCSPNLGPGHPEGKQTLYLRDRGQPLFAGAALAGTSSPSVSLEGDREPTGIARIEDPDHDALEGSDGASEILSATVAHRPRLGDLFVRIEVDRLSRLPFLSAGSLVGDPRLLYGLDLVVEGVPYQLRVASATDVTAGGVGPVFGLFRCVDECVEVARLAGGYGTAGEVVVAAVPVGALGLERGGVVSGLRAFAASGTYATGRLTVLDEAVARD